MCDPVGGHPFTSFRLDPYSATAVAETLIAWGRIGKLTTGGFDLDA